MIRRWRTAVLGFGRIGHAYADDPSMARYYRYSTHAQVLTAHPQFDWQLVIDPSPDALEAASTRWGVPHAFADVASAGRLAEEIEVVVLATPPEQRRGALDAFPRLRAVLVEKPLALTLADADAWLQACEDRKVLVQVNLWRRADAMSRELAAGRLHALVGDIQAVNAFYGNGLLNNGTHIIDYARMLFGEATAVERIGQSKPRVEGPIAGDDNPAFALSFESGAAVTFCPLHFSSYRENGLDIWGTAGRLAILNEGLTLLHYPACPNRAMNDASEIAADRPEALTPTVGEAFYRMYDNLAMALDGGTELWSSGHSALATSRVVESVREASSSGARVTVAAVGAGQRGLVFVEDPGAVNWLVPVAEALQERGMPPVLLSSGPATALLKQRGLHPVAVSTAEEALSFLHAGPPWLAVGTSENPDTPAFALVRSARQAGVPSVGVVDFAANAEFRFRGATDDPLAHVPDRVFVPDEFTWRQFAALGFAPERLVMAGRPHLEALEQSAARLAAEGRAALRRRVLPLPAGLRPVVVFVAEISTGFNPAQFRRGATYTLCGRGGHDGRTEIVIEELLDAVATLEAAGLPRPVMVLRLHPKQGASDLADLRSAFDVVSSGGDPLEVIYAADLVVGMSSQLLAEAHALGLPALAVLPRIEEREWLPEIRTGDVPSVTTRDALRAELTRTLTGPSVEPQRRPHQSRTIVRAFVDALAAKGT